MPPIATRVPSACSRRSAAGDPSHRSPRASPRRPEEGAAAGIAGARAPPARPARPGRASRGRRHVRPEDTSRGGAGGAQRSTATCSSDRARGRSRRIGTWRCGHHPTRAGGRTHHHVAVPSLKRIAVDTRALRESRDFRLVTAGSIVTGLGTQATLVALPYQVYVITRSPFLTGLLGWWSSGRSCRPPVRRRAGGPLRPPPSAAALPGGAGGRGGGAGRCRAGGPAARLVGVRPGRPGRRRRGGGARRAPVDRAQHGPARASARRAVADLRPLPADHGRGPGRGRRADRGARRGRRLRDRRGKLPGDGRGRLGDVAAAAGRRPGARARAGVDSDGPRVRAPLAGAGRQLRDRPGRDDVRDAARAVPRPLADRVPRRRQRHRLPAGLGGRRRDDRRADHRLARARALPGEDRAGRRGRLGAGDSGSRSDELDRAGGAAARRCRRGRQRERGAAARSPSR